MDEEETVMPASPADAPAGHLERGTVRHFKVVGTRWIETEAPAGPPRHDPDCTCTECQLDRALAVFGDDNLE